MWDALKGIGALLLLIGLALGVLIAGWTFSIFIRVIVLLLVAVGIIGFMIYVVVEWFRHCMSKKK